MSNCNCIQSEKPLKFVVDSMTADRKVCFAHPDSVDISSELRGQPTNLNYYNRSQTSLYGTAPYMGKGQTQFVDIETSLRDGTKMFDCNKPLSEITYPVTDMINCQNQDDSAFRPISTRSDLRNYYANQSKK